MLRHFVGVFCILGFASSHTSYYIFNGTLRCISPEGNRIPFTVWTLELWDRNTFFPDKLATTGYFILEDGAIYHVEHGDTRSYHYFRFFYKIDHDCTYSGKRFVSTVDVVDTPTVVGFTNYKMDINLLLYGPK